MSACPHPPAADSFAMSKHIDDNRDDISSSTPPGISLPDIVRRSMSRAHSRSPSRSPDGSYGAIPIPAEVSHVNASPAVLEGQAHTDTTLTTTLLGDLTNTVEDEDDDEDYDAHTSSSAQDEYYLAPNDMPWRYRGPALFVAVLLSFGSHWAGAAINPLKSTLKLELGITNLQFGILQGATSFVNTIVPLFGGLFIDRFGGAYGSVMLSSIVTIGALFVALSANFDSFPIIVFGRALFGIANSSLETVQSKIIAEWFVGKQLALVMGLYLSVARLGTFTGQITTIPVGNASGWWGWGLWVPVFFCLACTFMSIAYLIMTLHIESRRKVYRTQRKRSNSLSSGSTRRYHPFKWAAIFHLPGIFWLLCCVEYIQAGLLTSFIGTATDLIQSKFGKSASVAAYNAAVGQVLPICVFPLVGFFIDRYGHRLSVNVASSFALLLCMVLLGFSRITPIIPLLLFSVGLSLGPVSMLTSIPLLIPPTEGMGIAAVGTATGLWKCFNNAGSTVFDILVGLIQDNTPENEYNGVYGHVLYFYVSMAAFAIILGFAMIIVDKHNGWKSLLQRPGKDTTMAKLKELYDERIAGGRMNKSKFYRRIVPLSVFGLSVVSSWVMFFTFSVGAGKF